MLPHSRRAEEADRVCAGAGYDRERADAGAHSTLLGRRNEGGETSCPIRKRGKKYCYRFMWKGDVIEKSTGQGNANVARQMEAAYRTALARVKWELWKGNQHLQLKEFADESFLPYIAAKFAQQQKTKEYTSTV